MITLILWLIIQNNMNTLQFTFETTVSAATLYGYINFNIRKVDDLWNIFYDNDTKSFIIDTLVTSSDYSTLYPFVLEQISMHVKSVNGIVLYSSLDFGDPKLYTLLVTDIVVEIESVNELTL